ncbi:tetratricopeptide repeat protein [Kitasatospora aureofaciens]|uniref:tetratricopeptide repeat protein n=1 Tax=Kitasatospora aureofaciens TaxID=1894 RepID=UPI001C459407|nr:tetratricopeptide repeat protein [Kitasatospora aureofaciens]MBV6701335.1 tetratricopeptide repeat protein [Kitasatospora aureofaciens]
MGGTVVWCGTPGGRDDAALVRVDEDERWQAPTGPVRWGRMATDRPAGCETWGVPDVAQRADKPVEAAQLRGEVNPGSGFVDNQYVMDLRQHPPQWSPAGTSPWGGLSGAAVFCDRLLVGVVASERAYSGRGQLNVVPAYVLHHTPFPALSRSFSDVLSEHGIAPAALEAVEFQHLADPASQIRVRSGIGSPVGLLEAGRQTVPFHGREDLLERLGAWCALGGFGAWLLHGPGGQGKTRLAHHLSMLLAADRWAVLWPRTDATAAEVREIRHASKPLLVVLDYAETRTQQLAAIVEAAVEHPGTTPLKILLLARTDGDWWRRATNSRLSRDLLGSAPTHLLTPLENEPADRPGAYRDAVRALAAALPQVEGLAEHNWLASADTLPIPQLSHDVYGNALTLHMTALADLLDTALGPADQIGLGKNDGAHRTAEEVEDRLLSHESHYWEQSAAARGLVPSDLYPEAMEAALAAAHLVGATDRAGADAIWRRLPMLADQTRARRDQVTAWIASLYPAASGDRPWGVLQPDRLAERHIGRVLDDNPAIAAQLLDGADNTQASQLLTVYSRAAAHPVFHDRLDTQLTNLCTHNFHRLASLVIATAVQTDHPEPLITALDAVINDDETPLNDLITLHGLLPASSRRLASTAVSLAETITGGYRMLAEANPDAFLRDLASSLNNLSIRLGEAGRREEGLAAIEEAVSIRRALVESNPDAHLPDLAMCLNNLSVDLGELGRREEGLAAIEEAVSIRRALAESNPDAHLPDLATSLNNLSIRLGEAGRREEGLAACLEAVRHYRALAKAGPDTYLPDLALFLNNLSIRLGEAGRREEGLAACLEAVRHYRALAQANPDAHLPDLAMSLNNLSNRLGEAGRREEGLAACLEAVRHYRALAQANPKSYLPGLASSLNNLSVRLREAGQREEGLAAIEEAVSIRRALAESNPDAFLPDVASSLNNLSVNLGELGRLKEGLAASLEAVGIRRALVESNPDAFLPDLASSLNNLSVDLGDTGRWEEGLAAIEEAVGIRRALAEVSPDAFLPDLASSLNNLSNWLTEGGQQEEGLAASLEAVHHYRALTQTNPEAFLPDLASSLNNLSNRLGEAGRREEGLATIEEAVRHYRALAQTNPDAHLPDLAMSLHNLSANLGGAGRPDEGLATIQEAASIRRALAEAYPDLFKVDLQRSLKVTAWLKSLPRYPTEG